MDSSEWNKIVVVLTDEAFAGDALSFPGADPVEVRRNIAKLWGDVWDSYEVARDFDVLSFHAGRVFVRRKADGRRGSLRYVHLPRFYWDFTPDGR